MDVIHILLCGTDAYRVEPALQRTVENVHYAWGKRYSVSCTCTLHVEDVDPRILSACHAIVLCEGARIATDLESYSNKPILALNDAPEDCVDSVRDAENFAGIFSLLQLPDRLPAIALAPSHVLWDSLLTCLTPLGEQALQRAFWLLDKDTDGYLNDEEVIAWRRRTQSPTFNRGDLAAFMREWSEAIHVECQATAEHFVLLHAKWLSEKRNLDAWATLHAVGTYPNGLPYSWRDMHAIRADRGMNTYLSQHAIQFFSNLYKLNRFADMNDMWTVTPGCPWTGIEGFLSQGIPLDQFIEYWKYFALEKRDTVVMYARYWGYRGEAGFLFTWRNARAARQPHETLPNTFQVLLVGMEGSGKRSLMPALAGGLGSSTPLGRSELCVSTRTFYVRRGKEAVEEPQTVIYTTVSPSNALLILSNENLNKTFDVVLLCYDATNAVASGRYLMDLYTHVMSVGCCASMPFVVVQTKSDLVKTTHPDEVLEGTSALEAYCRSKQLLWPAVSLSAHQYDESEMLTFSEYLYEVAADPELAVGSPPLTLVRVLRRATLATILLVSAARVIQFAANRLRRQAV